MAVKKSTGPAPVSAAPASEKKQAIAAAMDQITRMYGKGAIMRLGDSQDIQVDVIPTGSLALDLALGVGTSYVCVVPAGADAVTAA